MSICHHLLAFATLLLLSSCASRAGAGPKGPASSADAWEEPALDPQEGSLWDFIEEALDGQAPTPEVLQASDELAEERRAERYFMTAEEGRATQDAVGWYRDPAALVDGDPLHLNRVDPADFDIPMVINDDVKRWMKYFLGNGRKWYGRWLARSTRYEALIHHRLDERGLPRDLLFLAMIESGFSPHAYSKAHAVGLWQFISPTGSAYGLRIDWWVDERRDPELATDAAVAHLHDLHKMFGDWYLAAAAYNAGPGRIRRAMARTGATDFWGLTAPGVLARETANYVPKLLAAAIIGRYPERYGFTDIDYEPPLAYDIVEVPHSVSIDSMARCAAADADHMRALNPALRRWSAPPDPERWAARIPEGKAEPFGACVAAIPTSERVAFQRHRVKKGESLGAIARAYGVTVASIVQMNRIKNANRIYVGMELVIPAEGQPAPMTASAAPAATPSKASSPPSHGSTTWHTVTKGETLASIAARHSTTIRDLMALNSLSNPDVIKAGQKLKVPGRTAAAATPAAHKVQRGETLSQIAHRYGVAVSDIQTWNSIANPSMLRAGQVLKLTPPEPEWISYTVRSGDNLTLIARRHGCTVDDLVKWNSLGSTTIKAGQRLRILKKS